MQQQGVRLTEPAGGAGAGLARGAGVEGVLAGVCLSWEVLADAPGVQRALGRTPSRARVVMTFRGGQVVVRVESLNDAGEPVLQGMEVGRYELGEGMMSRGGGAGPVHLDVPGVLRAVVGVNEKEPRVLYARTALLEQLGFPAGTFDRPVAMRLR